MANSIVVLDGLGSQQTVATNDAIVATLPATLGQKTSAASLAVVLASDQSAVPVSGTLTSVTSITNALPAGANVIGGVTVADGSDVVLGSTTDAPASAGGTGSLSAKLRRISTQLPAALGQTTASAGLAVTLASDQLSTTAYSTSQRLPVTEPDALAVSGTLTSAAVLFSQDMAGYESISVQVTSAGTTCTITYETSDDNTNWVSTSGISSAQIGSTAPAITSTTALLLIFKKAGRYFRARVSTYTSGTVTVVGNCHKSAAPLTNQTTGIGSVNTQGSTLNSGFQTFLAGYTANPAAVTTATAVRAIATIGGVPIQKPYSIPEADWAYAAAASGIVNTTTAVTLVGAGTAGVKNYLTAMTLNWDTLGAGGEIVVRNGAAGTVIWRGKLPTAAGQMVVTFPTPLQSSAATLLEFATLTASVTGGVYVNAQGYAAAD